MEKSVDEDDEDDNGDDNDASAVSQIDTKYLKRTFRRFHNASSPSPLTGPLGTFCPSHRPLNNTKNATLVLFKFS